MKSLKLDQEFYSQPCLTVAKELIGKYIIHVLEGQTFCGRIVETEAYLGKDDLASHARFGPTNRAKIMFGQPGRAYVFLIYGMYHCFNVVTEREGFPAAVLIRAIDPVENILEKTNGPGKVCRALKINGSDNNKDLFGDALYIEDRKEPLPRVGMTSRIGVDYAGEWANKPWRFIDLDSKNLSKNIVY